MNSFIRGLGGGIGRAIGRILGLIIVAILGFLLITYLDIDIKGVIRNTLFLNVKAQEQTTDITSTIRTNFDCPFGYNASGYCAIQTNNGGGVRSFNTRYNGVLNTIAFAFPYYFNNNGQGPQTIDIYSTSNDFRNNNINVYCSSYENSPSQSNNSNCSFRFISQKHIQVIFPYDSLQWHEINITSNNAITGVSNYLIQKVTLTYDDGQQDLSGIIDNATSNTTDIINNNNANSQDTQNVIIDSTNRLFESLNNMCPNLFNRFVYNENNNNIRLNNSGGFDVKSYGMSATTSLQQFCPTCQVGSTYYLNAESDSSNKFIYIGSIWDFGTQRTLTASDLQATVLFYGEYGSEQWYHINNLIISSENKPYCAFGSSTNKIDWISSGLSALGYTEEQIKEIQEDIKDTQQEMLETLKDDNIDTTQSNDFFNNFQDNTHGLSGIITIPLSTIQGLATKQCTPINLPIPYTGKSITLPCLTPIYEERVPVLLTLIRTLWFGILSYYVLTDIFFMVKGFKDPDSDKIEVLDL